MDVQEMTNGCSVDCITTGKHKDTCGPLHKRLGDSTLLMLYRDAVAEGAPDEAQEVLSREILYRMRAGS